MPSLFRVANDLYALAPEERNPEYVAGSKDGISDAGRAAQRKHGLGAWQVSGMFYGPSDAALEPQIQRVRAHFERSGKARYISHEEALGMAPLRVAIDSMDGRPSANEWACCSGGPAAATHGSCPARPWWANRRWRSIVSGAPFSPSTGWITSSCTSRPRDSRGLHVLVWNKDDKNENARADACYRELAETFARHGVGVGRARRTTTTCTCGR